MFGETLAEFADFFHGRDGVARHVVEQQAETLGGELGALEHQRFLLTFVLFGRLGPQVLDAKHRERRVLFKEMRQVEILASVETLLVEIHGADTHLPVVEVRREQHDKIIRAHVAEETDEATLIELHELLGDADRAEFLPMQPAVDKNISGNPDDVLFDEGRAVRDVVEAVGREQVLEFETVDAGGVGFLHVEIVLIVVVGVDDPDAKRGRVAEGAKIHAVDVEMVDDRKITVDLEDRVDFFQCLVEGGHLGLVVDHGIPERGLAVFVGERNDFVKRPESFVGDGEIAFATVAAEVAPEIWADGKARLTLGGGGFEKRRRGGGHGGECGVGCGRWQCWGRA